MATSDDDSLQNGEILAHPAWRWQCPKCGTQNYVDASVEGRSMHIVLVDPVATCCVCSNRFTLTPFHEEEDFFDPFAAADECYDDEDDDDEDDSEVYLDDEGDDEDDSDIEWHDDDDDDEDDSDIDWDDDFDDEDDEFDELDDEPEH